MTGRDATRRASFDLVTFDSPSPGRLAAFWCTALGLHEVEREDGDRWIVLAEAEVRRIGIQQGRTRTGSVHLDLACPTGAFTSELRRLLDAGATLRSPPRDEPYGTIANLADPDGNLFDLCAYKDKGGADRPL